MWAGPQTKTACIILILATSLFLVCHDFPCHSMCPFTYIRTHYGRSSHTGRLDLHLPLHLHTYTSWILFPFYSHPSTDLISRLRPCAISVLLLSHVPVRPNFQLYSFLLIIAVTPFDPCQITLHSFHVSALCDVHQNVSHTRILVTIHLVSSCGL